VAQHLADVDVGVVQQDVGVLARVSQHGEKIVAHVLVGVATVDEGELDVGQVVRGEKLVAAHAVVRHAIFHAEAREVPAHLVRVVPLRGAADGLEHAVGEHRIRGVDEAQPALRVCPSGRARGT
jgi:hypothetical protein